MRSDFGTQHVLGRLNSSGECALPEPPRKRTVKSKMPIAAERRAAASPESEKAVRKFAESLATGPFNSLASTVIKDLEGFAFGSVQNNSSKVLPHARPVTAPKANTVPLNLIAPAARQAHNN